MANKKYDWDEAKVFFLRSGVSLKRVSEVLNIPYQTVRRRSAQEKWQSDWCYLRMYWDLHPEDKETIQRYTSQEYEDFLMEHSNATKPSNFS